LGYVISVAKDSLVLLVTIISSDVIVKNGFKWQRYIANAIILNLTD